MTLFFCPGKKFTMAAVEEHDNIFESRYIQQFHEAVSKRFFLSFYNYITTRISSQISNYNRMENPNCCLPCYFFLLKLCFCWLLTANVRSTQDCYLCRCTTVRWKKNREQVITLRRSYDSKNLAISFKN